MSIDISSLVPGFELEDANGEVWGPIGGAATLLVFTSAACPEAVASHGPLLDVARDYGGRAVRVLLICPNDEAPPAPGEASPVPWLSDPTQEVARAYGATQTPEAFLLDADGKLRYRGAADPELIREGIEAILAGVPLVEAITLPEGCPIAWR
jgi:hypothetical protein